MLDVTFYDSDGATPIPGKELALAIGGAVDTPYRMGLRNTGTAAWPATYAARIKQSGLSDGASLLRIGLDTDTLAPPAGLAGVLTAPAAGGLWTVLGDITARVTAVDAVGETIASDPVTVALDDLTKKITWTWTAISGALSYNLYRGAGIVANVAGLTYLDDGAAPSATALPIANTTGGPVPTLSRNPVLIGALPVGGWAFLYIARVVPAAVDARLDPRIAGIVFGP